MRARFDGEEIEAKDEIKIKEGVFETKEPTDQSEEDNSINTEDNGFDVDTIYVSEKKRDLDISKYLLVVVIVLISLFALIGSKILLPSITTLFFINSNLS